MASSSTDDQHARAPPRGFYVAAMNLGGAVKDFNLSDGRREWYEEQLRFEMETLWDLPSDVVMLSEINPHWFNFLKTTLPHHWQIRHDDDDVALMWNTDVCRLLGIVDKELSYPDKKDSIRLGWRQSLQAVFEVVDPSTSAGQFHFFAGAHTHANHKSKNKVRNSDTGSGVKRINLHMGIAGRVVDHGLAKKRVTRIHKGQMVGHIIGDWNIYKNKFEQVVEDAK